MKPTPHAIKERIHKIRELSKVVEATTDPSTPTPKKGKGPKKVSTPKAPKTPKTPSSRKRQRQIKSPSSSPIPAKLERESPENCFEAEDSDLSFHLGGSKIGADEEDDDLEEDINEV